MNLQRALRLGQDIRPKKDTPEAIWYDPRQKALWQVPVNFRGLCDFGADYMLTPSQANLKFLQCGVRCMTEDVVGLDVPIMEEANLTPPVILPEIAGLMIRAYDSHWFPEYIFTTPKNTKEELWRSGGFSAKRGRPVFRVPGDEPGSWRALDFRWAMDSATWIFVWKGHGWEITKIPTKSQKTSHANWINRVVYYCMSVLLMTFFQRKWLLYSSFYFQVVRNPSQIFSM